MTITKIGKAYTKGVEDGIKIGFQRVLDFLGEKGFRDSNYEINNLIKWLWEQLNKK